MVKLRAAILEDNKEQLKDRKQNIEGTGLVEVVAWATSSEDFLLKVNESKTDVLILDIDLGGDSMSGLDIAYKMKLPVLFVSGHNAKNLPFIEKLKREFDIVVDHISKPFSDNDFLKTFARFIADVHSNLKTKFIYLDFGDTRHNKIDLDSIVYLCTDKNKGSESNNKLIFFTDRKPEILIDFSFSKMEDQGLIRNKFITIHKSFRINVDKISKYKKDTHEVEVEAMNNSGKKELFYLPVSENYRSELKNRVTRSL